MSEPALAAISYAHGPADQKVVALADRLNREGVDCDVDVYEETPPEGWARWMVDTMTRRTVLVIASQAYYERYHLAETTGKGLGTTFESGLLAQRVLDMQGKNEGVIPVFFDTGDAAFIPEFLRDVTRYDLSSTDGYERLYSRLTGQPRYKKPPLGQIRTMPARNEIAPGVPSVVAHPAQHLVLFQNNDRMFWAPIKEVERNGILTMSVLPEDDASLAQLRRLPVRAEYIGIAYGSSALNGRLRVRREKMLGSSQIVDLEFDIEVDGRSIEMTFNNISPDDVALMRARRILLNEKLPKSREGDWASSLNDTTLDSFVAGRLGGSGRFVVRGSPLPVLADAIGAQAPEFIPVARLACILNLILSDTVEHVTVLDLALSAMGVDVRFQGTRRQLYSNVPAADLEVRGTCPLQM